VFATATTAFTTATQRADPIEVGVAGYRYNEAGMAAVGL